MKNRTINIAVVAEVAEALRELKDQMVFVGGAVVSLYVDDPAADEIRPTQDIDMTLNIVNLTHWQEVQEKLAHLGFHPNPFGHAICSYKYKDIPVDIMAMEDGPLGPSNKWYKIGFDNLWAAQAKDQEIRILSAPCYLATKFEAYTNRGVDYRTSHDIEDIVYVLDNRIHIVEEIEKDDMRIRGYVKQQLKEIINKGLLNELLMSHIHPLMLEERMPIVEEKIAQILK
ncbi:MAG: nucleotidyl transferase AbiEii/AbiGii toxin family protein [Marinilabilia sp.]